MTDPEIEAELRKFALQNALEHGGEADGGAVMGRVMGARPELRDRADEVQAALGDVLADVNAMSVADQEAELADLDPELLPSDEGADEARGLPDLPDVADEVVMRFAPNPNGAPTIGHARGMVVNGEYVDRYGGELILRFDDTDPKVKPPLPDAYDWFVEDYEWLGYDPDLVFACSERLDLYHEHARTLLAQGHAYVCRCERGTFQDHRKEGVACEHRDIDPGANVEAFDGMLIGETEPGEAVVRIKTDMDHKDPALRDWVALRVVDEPHPRVPDARVWPMLDFASAIEDEKRGVTHIIRGKDLRDSTGRQRFLYDHLGWTYPETLYWGRVKIHEFGKFSTSTIAEKVRDGTYRGWDDPRLPTLRALERRGFQPSAVRELWIDQGLTEKDVAVSMKHLESANRTIVDPMANRYFLVADPRDWTLTGAEGYRVQAPLHPEADERGVREVVPDGDTVTVKLAAADADDLEVGDEVRLKDFVNVRVADEGVLEAVDDDLDRATELPILHFVLGDAVPARVLMPDGSTAEGIAEAAVCEVEPGTVVQFERFGFCCIDSCSPEQVVAVFAHR